MSQRDDDGAGGGFSTVGCTASTFGGLAGGSGGPPHAHARTRGNSRAIVAAIRWVIRVSSHLGHEAQGGAGGTLVRRVGDLRIG
jgi:hypothetical protein